MHYGMGKKDGSLQSFLEEVPPLSLSTVGAGVKPSALGGRASRQVGGISSSSSSSAAGIDGIWRAGQVGMCRHQGYERRGEYDRQQVTSLTSPPTLVPTITSSPALSPPLPLN